MNRGAAFYRNVARLALPILLQNLCTTLLGLIDTFMVGALGEAPLAAVLVADGLKNLKKMMSSSEVGGTALLGISKPVIKAHGSSDALAIQNAVRQASQVASSGIIENIAANIDVMRLDPVELEGGRHE